MAYTLELKKLSLRQADIFKDVLKAAALDAYLGGPDDDITKRPVVMVILTAGKPIGFHCPKEQSWDGVKHYRAGVLFLLPEHRGQGHMKEVLKEFFQSRRPGLSWIDDENENSQALFKSLGFKRDKPKISANGEVGHWWVLPKGSLALENRPPTIYEQW